MSLGTFHGTDAAPAFGGFTRPQGKTPRSSWATDGSEKKIPVIS